MVILLSNSACHINNLGGKSMLNKLKFYINNKRNRKNLLIAGIAIIIVIIAIIYFISTSFMNTNDNIESNLTTSNEVTKEEDRGSIYIDITGAVNEPSVIVLPEGSRVFEAIEAAGGLTDDANLTDINRAEILEDGAYLYIPTNKEVAELSNASSETTGSTGLGGAKEGKININLADSNTLQQLNGVGPATAEKIIDYRTNSGKFKKIEDLKNVSGIGEKTFEKLEPHIKV